MANTQISYLYRDSSNYKSYASVIVNGRLTESQISTILSTLQDGEYFVPEMLDLNAERNWDFDPEVDDYFWELTPTDFTHTEKAPTIEDTPEQLVEKFLQAKHHWSEYTGE